MTSCWDTSMEGSGELRDHHSITGLTTSFRTIAARGNVVIARKSARSLWYLDVQTNDRVELTVDEFDAIHEDCQIINYTFLEENLLALVLQSQSNNRPTEIFIVKARIDLSNQAIHLDSPITATKLRAGPHTTLALVHDEEGAVLVSHPAKFDSKNDTIELFAVTAFFMGSTQSKLTVQMKNPLKKPGASATVALDQRLPVDSSSVGALVPLAGTLKGQNSSLVGDGDQPSLRYLQREIVAFDDYILLYAYNHLEKLAPAMFRFDISSLKWSRVPLTLSHHQLQQRVSFARAASVDESWTTDDTLFLHGDCATPNCTERSHLYVLNADTTSLPPTPPTDLPRADSVVSMDSEYSTPPSSAKEESICSAEINQAGAQRYMRQKQSNGNPDEKLTRHLSSSSLGAISAQSLDSLNASIASSKSAKKMVVDWRMEIAESTDLRDQMKKAKEMGFSDDAILEALRHNSLGKDKYAPFTSVDAMLDALTAATERLAATAEEKFDVPSSSKTTTERPKFGLSIFNEDRSRNLSKTRNGTPRTSSVGRSLSFHSGCENINPIRASVRLQKDEGIARLIKTFEDSERRLQQDAEQHIVRLKDENRILHEQVNECRQAAETHRREYEGWKLERRNMETSLDAAKKQEEKAANSAHLHRRNYIELTHEKRTLEDALGKKTHDYRTLKDHYRQLQSEFEQKRTETAELKDEITRLKIQLKELSGDGQLAVIARAEKAEAEADALRRQLDDTPKCLICLDKPPRVVFMACLHMTCCGDCSENLQQCPSCRQKIVGKIQVFT